MGYWVVAEYKLIFIGSIEISRSNIRCNIRLRDAMVSSSSFSNHAILSVFLMQLLQLLHIIIKKIARLLLLQRKANLLLCKLHTTCTFFYSILSFVKGSLCRLGYKFLNYFLLRSVSWREEMRRWFRSIF